MFYGGGGIEDDAGIINSGEEQQANANLIAAAPEMFDLLNMIHLSFGGGDVITFSEKNIEDIQNVINKALGTK